MRVRLSRLAVVIGVVTLMGGLTPPVEATTVSSSVFLGTVTIGSGLGYPCTGASAGGAPMLDLLLCPWTKVFNIHPINGDLTPTGPLVVTLPLPAGPLSAIPNVHLDFHRSKTPILGTAPIFCVNQVVNISKPGKAPAHLGFCGFGLAPAPLNTIAGNCGLNSGQMVWVFVDALGNFYTLDMHFNGAPFKVVTGHAFKPGSAQTGKVLGVMDWTPVPTTPALGNSCLRKTATIFTITGTLTIIGI